MFEIADAYEDRMGRWSRQLAPLFVQFVGVQDGEKLLMLAAALAPCQQLWPESRGPRRSSASILLRDSSNMRERKVPMRV